MPAFALVDIGANLAHDSFDRDREAVISRSRDAGIAAIVVTGSTLDDSARAATLCRQWPKMLRCTAGVHPHHAVGLRQEDLPRLRELLTDPMVVAAGECGLDFNRNFSPPADQRRAFEWQLGVVEETGQPLFLHQRDAHAEFVAMLRAHPAAASRGVIHCFTGGVAELDDCLSLGLSIGVTGWIDDQRRGHALREAALRIPTDRLLIETDAPYLLPRSLTPKPRERRNEPMHLVAVLAALSACRGEALEEIARVTTANACRFFGLTLHPADAAGSYELV